MYPYFSQMGNLSKRLSERLRTLRGDMPQLQFAKKLGISSSSLNRIEIGEQNVTLEMLERFCVRLKCDIADLFPPEKNPKRKA